MQLTTQNKRNKYIYLICVSLHNTESYKCSVTMEIIHLLCKWIFLLFQHELQSTQLHQLSCQPTVPSTGSCRFSAKTTKHRPERLEWMKGECSAGHRDSVLRQPADRLVGHWGCPSWPVSPGLEVFAMCAEIALVQLRWNQECQSREKITAKNNGS